MAHSDETADDNITSHTEEDREAVEPQGAPIPRLDQDDRQLHSVLADPEAPLASEDVILLENGEAVEDPETIANDEVRLVETVAAVNATAANAAEVEVGAQASRAADIALTAHDIHDEATATEPIPPTAVREDAELPQHRLRRVQVAKVVEKAKASGNTASTADTLLQEIADTVTSATSVIRSIGRKSAKRSSRSSTKDANCVKQLRPPLR